MKNSQNKGGQIPVSGKGYSDASVPLIRDIAILANSIGMLYYLGWLALVLIMDIKRLKITHGEWLIDFFIPVLPPLILTTYLLWYLKHPKKDKCEISIVIVIPVVIFGYNIITNISVSNFFLEARGTYIRTIIEVIITIIFTTLAIRRGYIRKSQAEINQESQARGYLDTYAENIHAISVLINSLGIFFTFSMYVLMTQGTEPSFSLGYFLASLYILWMFGLAPLIVTSYFLWYLKQPRENIFGIFIVTPAAVFTHYIVMGLAAHAQFLGKHGDYIMMIGEFIAAIVIVVIARLMGYTRNRSTDVRLESRE